MDEGHSVPYLAWLYSLSSGIAQGRSKNNKSWKGAKKSCKCDEEEKKINGRQERIQEHLMKKNSNFDSENSEIFIDPGA